MNERIRNEYAIIDQSDPFNDSLLVIAEMCNCSCCANASTFQVNESLYHRAFYCSRICTHVEYKKKVEAHGECKFYYNSHQTIIRVFSKFNVTVRRKTFVYANFTMIWTKQSKIIFLINHGTIRIIFTYLLLITGI